LRKKKSVKPSQITSNVSMARQFSVPATEMGRDEIAQNATLQPLPWVSDLLAVQNSTFMLLQLRLQKSTP
jgi:hypothetical protein